MSNNPVRVQATDVVDYIDGGDGPGALNEAFAKALEEMQSGTGPQELTITVVINNDLEESEDE